ncbi:serine hydrolase [Myxococcus stipitatus]|uniref:serine hydrolase n=1 Tax=Myxococcus stipitatus TaxID=83455 RepID=UPI0031450E4A
MLGNRVGRWRVAPSKVVGCRETLGGRVASVGVLGGLAVSLLTGADAPRPATQWLHRAEESARVARVEAGLEAVPLPGGEHLRLTLAEWMALYKLPGLSIAVFEGNSLRWAKSYGVTRAGGSEPVTLETLFQAGSISKPMTALAVAHHAQQGRWSLDEDVNGKLVSWKVPDSPFTRKEKVTLRRLLSHSAGLPMHGFDGYASGAPVPTLLESLEGKAPANSPPVRVVAEPGTVARYSNLGLSVVQQVMVDVLEKPFARIMRETVLQPLDMTHSTFEQPLPPALVPLAATGTRADGSSLPGGWHTYPDQAAAGLWTTPSDLARFAIEVSKARVGTSRRVVSRAMAKELLSRQGPGPTGPKPPPPWQPERFGLGFRLQEDPSYFAHGGWVEGYRSQLVAYSNTGSGVVLMTNSDNGRFLLAMLADAVAREYGWKSHVFIPRGPYGTADLIVRLRGVDTALAWFKEQHAAGAREHQSSEALGGLGNDLLRNDKVADAVKVFEANAALFPQDAEAHVGLAQGYIQAGRADAAIASLKKSLALAPKHEEAMKLLASLGARP